MSVERWHQIKSIVVRAMETPEDKRGKVLSEACGADIELRVEVESLLAAADATESLPEARAAIAAASGSLVAEREGALLSLLESVISEEYEIIRPIGRGGMGTVYLARDLRHKRPVALKVLAPHLGVLLGPARFRREIETAAGLMHPHILAVHDSGEAAGLLYYVMPYVAGGSLHARLARLTPGERVPLADALVILRAVAQALAYAHAHGVVHRDVKPENVLLGEDGGALLADFGIAKALAAATMSGATDAGAHEAVSAASLTQTGASLGTPAYMAPEQAVGEAVDHRADLYAWGVIAYELLAGAHPFAGKSTTAQLVAAHLAQAPAPLEGRSQDVPPRIAALVLRCLAKSPEDRPGSATDIVRELDGSPTPDASIDVPAARATRAFPGRARVLAGLGAVLLVVALAVARSRRADLGRAPVQPVLAVLPFENLGPPGDAYFADGLTDEVRSRLTSVTGLRVIGGTSARQYRGSTKSVREIGRELGATHLLTGTVRWERAAGGRPGRVRVSPELVRVTDQASVWAEPSEGPLADVFAVQTAVAERVAAALDVALLAGDRRAVDARPTANLAAYDAYLRALAYAADADLVSAAARREATEDLERAVALDPRFALAHARLAMVYLDELAFGKGSGTLEKARASVDRATALDSTLVIAHLARARLFTAEGDRAGAYRTLAVAARGAPNDAAVVYWTGRAQLDLERVEEAVENFRRAARLEPRWSAPLGQLAGAYDRLYRYEEAINARERAVVLESKSPSPWSYVFQAASYLLWRADTAAARQTLARSDPRLLVGALTRLPLAFAGRAIWLGVAPPAVLAAQDTLTFAGHLAGNNWGTPGSRDVFHLMKARHFAATGRPERARAHADSIIALLQPVLRFGSGASFFFGFYAQRATLAEAYAYSGRAADAAQAIDRYVDDARHGRGQPEALRASTALVAAAYVDVLIGRRELAVARLAEALRLPAGMWISRALLRADPTWASLRGRPDFKQLIAAGN
jgi:TolB-like protein/Flp pilus assembly protein TadD